MSSQKTILITGCSRGIGLNLVQEYINKGWKVLATCRAPGRADQLSSLLASHQQPAAIALDVDDDASVRAAFATVQNMNVRHLDVLFNNAGVLESGSGHIASVSRAELNSVFSTNVTSQMVVTQTFLPMIKAAPQAKVIFMSTIMSSMALNMGGGKASYRITKAALNMMTRMFAGDVGGAIYVSMHPGWVQTDMGQSVGPAPLSPADSCRGMAQVIDSLGSQHNGTFVDYQGRKVQW